MLKLTFTGATPDELTAQIKDYVKGLKGTRGGKGDAADEGAGTQVTGQTAPAPLQPLQGTFNPGAGGAAAFNPGFGSVDPAVLALVQRIATRIDGLISSGQQPADSIVTWFRSQLGAEAAGATLDQIKQTFLPKASTVALENITKLIGA